jgi:phage pi2 protein 07
VVDLNEELTRVASERAALAAQVGGISHGPQEKGDRWIMPQALRVPVPVPVSESES